MAHVRCIAEKGGSALDTSKLVDRCITSGTLGTVQRIVDTLDYAITADNVHHAAVCVGSAPLFLLVLFVRQRVHSTGYHVSLMFARVVIAEGPADRAVALAHEPLEHLEMLLLAAPLFPPAMSTNTVPHQYFFGKPILVHRQRTGREL
jgi:hypothetical protein